MGKELYVTNLPYDVTEERVQRLFSVSGRVVSINPITDPGGKFKGCVYVRMGSDAEAADAVASLDGALLDGRTIGVSISRTKAERTASPQRAPRQRTSGKRKP